MRPELQVLRATCEILVGLNGLSPEEREEVTACVRVLLQYAHSADEADHQSLASLAGASPPPLIAHAAPPRAVYKAE